jgi:hypothetical protein
MDLPVVLRNIDSCCILFSALPNSRGLRFDIALSANSSLWNVRIGRGGYYINIVR